MKKQKCDIDYSFGNHLDDEKRLVIRINTGNYSGSILSLDKIVLGEDKPEVNYDILLFCRSGTVKQVDKLPKMFYNDVDKIIVDILESQLNVK